MGSYGLIRSAMKLANELSEGKDISFQAKVSRLSGNSDNNLKVKDNNSTYNDNSSDSSSDSIEDAYESNSNERYSMDSAKIKENASNIECTIPNEISLELNKENILQAYVYSEIFGKPKCRRRRGVAFGFKGYNR